VDRTPADVVVYERVLPALAPTVGRVREELDAAIAVLAVDGERRQAIALAVSEAATNAVLHAYVGGASGPVAVEAVLIARDVVVTVADAGSGMRPRTDSPGLGVGLSVLSQVCDEVEVADARGGGTQVCMTFRDAAPALNAPSCSQAVQATVRGRNEAAAVRDYVNAVLAESNELHMDASAVVAQARQAVAHSAERRRARRVGRDRSPADDFE